MIGAELSVEPNPTGGASWWRVPCPTKDENGTSGSRSVFIVDDHPLVREWLTNLINQQRGSACLRRGGKCAAGVAGHRRSQASGGQSSIFRSRIRSGLELIKDMKQLEPTVKGLPSRCTTRNALRGARVARGSQRLHHETQETTGRVIEAIRQVIEGKVYVSEAVTQAMTARFVGGHAQDNVSPVELLSDRELEVFVMLGRGMGTRQIAESLKVSFENGAKRPLRAGHRKKLHLKNATELLREAILLERKQRAETNNRATAFFVSHSSSDREFRPSSGRQISARRVVCGDQHICGMMRPPSPKNTFCALVVVAICVRAWQPAWAEEISTNGAAVTFSLAEIQGLALQQQLGICSRPKPASMRPRRSSWR